MIEQKNMDGQLGIAVYHNLHSGGAKRTLYEEVRRLAERHRLDLYTLSSADNDFCDVRSYVNNIHVYDFELGPVFHSPFGRLNQGVRLVDLTRLHRLAQRIAADIDAGGYDVVLVHPCQYTQCPLVLQYLRTPTVYYCHEPLRKLYEPPVRRPYEHGQRSFLRRVLDRIDVLAGFYRVVLRCADQASLRSASRVLVNSRFTQINVRRIYDVEARVCPHGVDTEVFRPMGLSRDGTVLSVGALTPNKGFDFVIEGLGCIPASQRPRLIIVSNYAEPRERAFLERLAAERGVTVEFKVNVDDEALVQMYNRAALVAYAPIREPLGLVPLEAMSCGTPVVGVREGGVAETVVHNEGGLLTEREPSAFARAMQTLLSEPGLASQQGQRGRQYVLAHWTWDKAVRELETHLAATATGYTGRGKN
ncbi:MAG: glycosyltransferase family 4 protein [Anaerolineae bacterium]|nr:glycosyltransferase family 4 protein [Anaerolineae bacterium]